MNIQQLKITDLKANEAIMVRAIKQGGIDKFVSSLKDVGYLDTKPVIVNSKNEIIEGNHRVAACRALGIESVPVIIKNVTDEQAKQIAFRENAANEESIPMTFVDFAEFIWKQTGTQQQTADVLGWGISKVKQYSALDALSKEAWSVIVTTFENSDKLQTQSAVTEKVTFVTFSEGLLRPIINLADSQQLELVRDFANGVINKNKFTKLAEQYKQMNADALSLRVAVGDLVSDEILEEGITEIFTGNYDLDKLIQWCKDKHYQTTSIQLFQGDFFDISQQVNDGQIDLIITDPPYNIAHDNDAVYEGRKNVSSDFGEWDKREHEEFKGDIERWAEIFSRILAPTGSGYIFTSDAYISHIREALEKAGLHYRATLVWHKTNPGTSPTKSNFISSVEYIVYFSKGTERTFNWMGDNDMQNFIESPVCAGNERIKDAKGNTLHPTQKPLKVIRHLMDISSNKGDMVFDGFMGSGTTAHTAKIRDRRFIGIEMDEVYFAAAQARVK